MRVDPLPPNDDLITDYVSGALSSEDRERFEVRVATDPMLAVEVDRVRRALAVIEPLGPGLATSAEVDLWFNRLDERLQLTTGGRRSASEPFGTGRGIFSRQALRAHMVSKPASPRRSMYGTAAALVIVLSMVLFRASQPSSTSGTGPQVARRYTTTVGQQATVTLPDGSRALLGPATTLAVIRQSSGEHVDVQVDGQALFTVHGSRDRLFRVRAGNAIARVLGTTFMVRRYRTDSVSRVVVADGRVSVSGIDRDQTSSMDRVLTAGTLGVINDSGQVRVTPRIAVEEYTGWATGQLVFRDTPMRDAVAELGRAYGVNLRVADSVLAAQPLNWSVKLSQRSLADVLESLSAALDIRVVRNGQTITLVPGRSSSRQPVRSYPPSTSERQYGR
jgi:ferric-dicitrate binding protein FerR (iron transport regulator)